MKKNCTSCQWYEPSDNSKEQGLCIYDPPKIFMVPGNVTGTVQFASVQPGVDKNRVCSKHKTPLKF